MTTIADVLQRAQQRTQTAQLPYAGALTPEEAFVLLQQLPGAVLVDVRTQAEWTFVGGVANAVQIEWKSFPGMQPNPAFLAQLQAQVPAQAHVLFLCRSGARSHDAAVAATAAGFSHCYNILEGFEGDRDANGQRGRLNGWQAAGLPWNQG
jgi:rhodanese-related sulfurtransferase